MAFRDSRSKNRVLLFVLATTIVSLLLYLFYAFEPAMRSRLGSHMAGREDSVLRIPALILWGILIYLAVRALNTTLFGAVFRFRRGYEAPTLVRNIFSIVAFIALFFFTFNKIYPEVNLGAIFTTSAIFGVIIGLALQDTLGNFFAGISLHADRPFQVGDVIAVGQQDRKSTRLNSSHQIISYAVFCLKKKKQ